MSNGSAAFFESTEDQMGYPQGDWAPTRDPKRNAEITREVKKEAAYEAAYLEHLQAFRERRAQNLPGTDAENIPVAPESKILRWIALGGGLS
jgi:hypothetical protein